MSGHVKHVVMRYDPDQWLWPRMSCIYCSSDYEKAFDYAFSQAIKSWTDEGIEVRVDSVVHDDSQYTTTFEYPDESDVKFIIDTCQDGDTTTGE